MEAPCTARIQVVVEELSARKDRADIASGKKRVHGASDSKKKNPTIPTKYKSHASHSQNRNTQTCMHTHARACAYKAMHQGYTRTHVATRDDDATRGDAHLPRRLVDVVDDLASVAGALGNVVAALEPHVVARVVLTNAVLQPQILGVGRPRLARAATAATRATTSRRDRQTRRKQRKKGDAAGSKWPEAVRGRKGET